MAYGTPTMMQRICEYSTSPQLELSRDTSIKGRAEESRPRKGFDCRCCIFLICCRALPAFRIRNPIAASPADDKILSEADARYTQDQGAQPEGERRRRHKFGEFTRKFFGARQVCAPRPNCPKFQRSSKSCYLPRVQSSVLTPQDDTSHSPSQRELMQQ